MGMKLSEAMMLPTDIKLDSTNFCGCLLGQAFNTATGKLAKETAITEIEAQWPWLCKVFPVPAFVAPLTNSDTHKALDIISLAAYILDEGLDDLWPNLIECRLNSKLTREQVVDWVRSVEPEEEPLAVQSEEEPNAVLV
jgi:hypothetical protein